MDNWLHARLESILEAAVGVECLELSLNVDGACLGKQPEKDAQPLPVGREDVCAHDGVLEMVDEGSQKAADDIEGEVNVVLHPHDMAELQGGRSTKTTIPNPCPKLHLSRHTNLGGSQAHLDLLHMALADVMEQVLPTDCAALTAIPVAQLYGDGLADHRHDELQGVTRKLFLVSAEVGLHPRIEDGPGFILAAAEQSGDVQVVLRQHDDGRSTILPY